MGLAGTSAAFAVGLALLLGSSVSAAQPADERRALQLFEQSAVHYREGRFAEAVELLQEAYRLKPIPVLLYNLARAYEGLGDTKAAIDAYRRFLAEESTVPDRAALERRLATLERQLAEHEALEAHKRAETDKAAAPPAPLANAPRSAGAAEPAPAARSVEGPRASPAPWVVMGVGVLGVGAGAVLGAVGQARHDSAVHEPDVRAAEDLQSSAHGFATGANIAFVAGGAMALVGAIWGAVDLWGNGTKPASSAALHVGPLTVSLKMSGRSP